MLLKLLTEVSKVTFDCNLYHDINGNLLATIIQKGDIKTKTKIYRLDIDKDDRLKFTRIKNMGSLFSVVDNKISYNTIQNVLDNSLKKKAIEKIDPENPYNCHEEL